jgi:hypothetical protein
MYKKKHWSENLRGREHLEDAGVDGRVTQNRSHRNRMRGCRLDSSGSVQEPVEGQCEHCNEPSGSVKEGSFLTSYSRSTLLH